MHTFILDSIVEKAEDLGYQLVKAEDGHLWFSRDGESRPDECQALFLIQENDEPIDFIALSPDPRFLGAIGRGWKFGSTALVQVTEMGMIYEAMTDEEVQALIDRIHRPPTHLESMEMAALIDEAMTDVSTPASERAKIRYVEGIDKDRKSLQGRRLLAKLRLDGPRN